MDYYYVTGTSRGLGKALVERLLGDENNQVIGMARGQGIEHPRYRHIQLDLADPPKVQAFRFEPHPDASRVALVNNAGVLDINPVGSLSSEAIINGYNVNLVSPTLLTNSFIEAYRNLNAEKVILNISSGAGRRPTDGWGVYCATKAGIDMLSRVIAEEERLTTHAGFHVLSVAPGLVNTEMQGVVRSASGAFSRGEDFWNSYRNGQLADPAAVAEKLCRLLGRLDSVEEVVVSLRDFD